MRQHRDMDGPDSRGPKTAPRRWDDRKPLKAKTGRAPVVTRRMQAISELLEEMARTPASGVRMCHEQGKTAVYLSDDGKDIVEHPPHGPIKRTPFKPGGTRER